MDYKTELLDVLDSAKQKDYTGYSKFDALNSPALQFLTFNNKWLRLILTQVVKMCPVHIRPLLLVKKSRNPKGIALFARAYLFLYETTKNKIFLNEAEKLLQWLLNKPSTGYKNLCWGYNFIWQNTIFLQDKFEPNAVVTTFIGEAMIHAYRVTGNEKYLSAARSVSEFIVNDLPVLEESSDERAIAYVCSKADAVVLNNQVLTGALLVKVWKHTGDKELLDIAVRQFNYTVNRRTDYHAWYYTHPSEKSHITHDNYHTGGILDSLLEYYEETNDDQFMDVYWKGMEFYEKNLFEEDGAPRWMNNRKYPFDIHGAAQGIISFAKAGKYNERYTDLAEKILKWTLENLFRHKKRDFIYRQGRFVKWNYSLMRWCNAWMGRAMGELICS